MFFDAITPISAGADWVKFFERIRKSLGYDAHSDQESAGMLDSLMMEPSRLEIPPELNEIFFIGAGPSADGQLVASLSRDGAMGRYVVAADGAARLLLSRGFYPDAVVTDLDGLPVPVLAELAERGAKLIVHAHGDNMGAIAAASEVISGNNIVGTTQVPPFGKLVNPGGFTDGDRGPFLYHHLVGTDVVFRLVGYDFSGPVGRWSKPTYSGPIQPSETKAIKLVWAKKCLKYLTTLGRQVSFE